MYIIGEGAVISQPAKIKTSGDKVRFEAIIQTCNDINRNKRKYTKKVLEEGVNVYKPRIKEGSALGELDHPISEDAVRQCTVLYNEASHKFLEMGFEGNKLVAVIETLAGPPKGMVLKKLITEDKIPVGFSFRGTGELRTIRESGDEISEVVGPLNVITWDSVSYPSHATAKLIKINESVNNQLQESVSFITNYKEQGGVIITESGFTFLPDAFDRYVDLHLKTLSNKFKNI